MGGENVGEPSWLGSMQYKQFIKRFVDEGLLGRLDYLRSAPEDRDWAGPFNGQSFRRDMFLAISKALDPFFVLETGTFRGVTTEFLARQFALPVFSIESSRRNYGFACARLDRWKNVHLFYGDSVQTLRRLFEDGALPRGYGLFYLDAHWEQNLPLRDEVSAIFENLRSAVVVVDDFAVPDDPGYAYDDYGESGSLTVSYLAPVLSRFGLRCFFPNCHSSAETGKKRGSCVLADAALSLRLGRLSQLREIS